MVTNILRLSRFLGMNINLTQKPIILPKRRKTLTFTCNLEIFLLITWNPHSWFHSYSSFSVIYSEIPEMLSNSKKYFLIANYAISKADSFIHLFVYWLIIHPSIFFFSCNKINSITLPGLAYLTKFSQFKIKFPSATSGTNIIILQESLTSPNNILNDHWTNSHHNFHQSSLLSQFDYVINIFSVIITSGLSQLITQDYHSS